MLGNFGWQARLYDVLVLGFFLFSFFSFVLFSYKSSMASEFASISVSTLITAFFFFKCLQSSKLVSAKDSK